MTGVALELKAELAASSLEEADHPAAARKAVAMHLQTIAAANSFHALFCERHRDGKAAEDHYEQDLLRAMLLFACSGLDAIVKQLVREGLEGVIANDAGAQREFAKYIERRLKRGSGEEGDRVQGGQASLDFSLLSEALASPEPRQALIRALIRNLTNDSLQSRDQLLRVAAHFALTRDEVLADDKATQEAFQARNQLSHEMDIDFQGDHRRRDRSYHDMVRWSENILEIARNFVQQVSTKLTTPEI